MPYACSPPQRIVRGSLLFKMLLQNCLRALKRVQCMSGTKIKEQRTQICTCLIFRDNSRFESVGDFSTLRLSSRIGIY